MTDYENKIYKMSTSFVPDQHHKKIVYIDFFFSETYFSRYDIRQTRKKVKFSRFAGYLMLARAVHDLV